RDAGLTWEPLPNEPFGAGRLGFFGFPLHAAATPVLFGLRYAEPSDPRAWSLFRSDDLGTSWQQALMAPLSSVPPIRIGRQTPPRTSRSLPWLRWTGSRS